MFERWLFLGGTFATKNSKNLCIMVSIPVSSFVCMNQLFRTLNRLPRNIVLRVHLKFWYYIILVGWDSSVSIATSYGLDGLGIEPRWGARFSAPVQTGPGAHPTSYTVGTRSFSGVENSWGVTLTPHPLLVPLVVQE
jgi:hypothetical protein